MFVPRIYETLRWFVTLSQRVRKFCMLASNFKRSIDTSATLLGSLFLFRFIYSSPFGACMNKLALRFDMPSFVLQANVQKHPIRQASI